VSHSQSAVEVRNSDFHRYNHFWINAIAPIAVLKPVENISHSRIFLLSTSTGADLTHPNSNSRRYDCISTDDIGLKIQTGRAPFQKIKCGVANLSLSQQPRGPPDLEHQDDGTYPACVTAAAASNIDRFNHYGIRALLRMTWELRPRVRSSVFLRGRQLFPNSLSAVQEPEHDPHWSDRDH
jgi:hypothetical protein